MSRFVDKNIQLNQNASITTTDGLIEKSNLVKVGSDPSVKVPKKLRGLSMTDLVDQIISISAPDLHKLDVEVIDLLTNIFREKIQPTLLKDAKIFPITYRSTLSDDRNLKSLTEAINLCVSEWDNGHEDSEESSQEPSTSRGSRKKDRKRDRDGGVYRRSNLNSFSGDFVSVSRTRNVNLVSHLTNADLSLLTDFDKRKDELGIVHKSFVTLDKPIKFKKCKLHVRDTMLLMAGNKSLSALGKLYGENFEKVKISNEELENMAMFLDKDPARFKEYALQDSIIVLIHACYMEDYYFKLDKMGVPLTLSAISKALIDKDWRDRNYKGYQVSPNIEL